jgi:hypothetical protein
MRTGYLSSWAASILMLATANSVPTAAEESGHWHGLSVLVVTDQKMAKVEDRANHMVYVTEFDGAVYNADGKPFLDKARYQVVVLVDVGVTAGGYKTFTEADGSKVFLKFTVTEGKSPIYVVRLSSQAARENTKESPATELSMTCSSVTRRHGTNLLVNTRFQRRQRAQPVNKQDRARLYASI